jgi:hypothetical protein
MKRFSAFLLLFVSVGFLWAGSAMATNYAVLFSGGISQGSNHDRYYEETLRMWDIMTGTLGYQSGDVYVLFGDGTDAAVDRSSGENSDWSTVTSAGSTVLAGTEGNLQSTLVPNQASLR